MVGRLPQPNEVPGAPSPSQHVGTWSGPNLPAMLQLFRLYPYGVILTNLRGT